VGEGLHREPPWKGRLANVLVPDVDLDRLGEALAATLEPLLVVPRTSSFGGPFALHLLDLREVDDDFLPGAMHAAAASIVCVHDRLRSERHAAVALAARGASRTLGTSPCLSDAPPGTDGAVDAVLGPGKVMVAGREVALAAVSAPQAHLVMASGFVVVSAVDSQRLWVLESGS
jgi:hypothetical protein